MTVRASLTAETLALEAARTSAAPPTPVQAAFGIVVGGTPSGDVIVMSQRALAIVRAGLLVHAFVIAGLATLQRTVVLGAHRMLRLQYGIYQLV